MLPFVSLWKAIMKDGSLLKGVNQWILSSSVYWAEATTLLVIRERWIEYRDMILSSYPCCVKLAGKSGRGKSVFLRYLIFYILLGAAELDTADAPEHLTHPSMAFMDRDGVLYHITKDSIEWYRDFYHLVAAVGQPHFYFSDNVDVDNAGAGSLATMALTSGDADVLKNFSKRINEARFKTRLILTMPGLELDEMLRVFPDLNPQEVAFKFDIVGGNPRLACARVSADEKSSHFPLVTQVVEMMFPAESATHKRWAVTVVCNSLDKAKGNKTDGALDSSAFRDFFVTAVEEGAALFGEVFASTFMGLVASCIYSMGEETTKATLLKLFGSAGAGAFFEYEAQLAFFEAGPDVVYNCFCQRTGQIVKLHLGGGNPKLIRSIEDLRSLRDGDCGIPTVSNFAIIDRALFRTRPIGLQMTHSLKHVGGVTKLRDMLDAFDIQNEEDFSIVFVVPEDHLERFVFPTNLGNVSLYVTTCRPSSESVFKKLVSKKRRLVH